MCGDNRDLMKAVKVQDVGRREGQQMNWRAKIRTKHKIGVWDHSKLDCGCNEEIQFNYLSNGSKYNFYTQFISKTCL